MNSVNFVRELVPPYPLRTNARAGRALRQLSLVGTDAEPTQLTQAGRANVMANLNAGAFEAPEGSAEEQRGNGSHSPTVFRLSYAAAAPWRKALICLRLRDFHLTRE